jgi:hypothetical protein
MLNCAEETSTTVATAGAVVCFVHQLCLVRLVRDPPDPPEILLILLVRLVRDPPDPVEGLHKGGN